MTIIHITERKEHVLCGGKRPASLSLIHSVSSVCRVRLFAFLHLLCSLKDLWVQYWLQGYRHAHTNGVFCGKWLRSLSITLCCYCVVSLLISHSVSQLHMAQRVLPPTPCLSRSRSHTDYAAGHCVWSFDVRTKARRCLMLSNVRENTTWAFTVYARNGKRHFVQLCNTGITLLFEVRFYCILS